MKLVIAALVSLALAGCAGYQEPTYTQATHTTPPPHVNGRELGALAAEGADAPAPDPKAAAEAEARLERVVAEELRRRGGR